jgi:short subunit dehydrogenase-like uncharacterized protein
MTDLLIYGATGYTGALIAKRAAGRGLAPVLAARGEARLRGLAERLGCPWRLFDLHDPHRIRDAVRGAAVVLNAAGPFSATARPMVDACVAVGATYVDITGEIDVLEALAARHEEAVRAGVVLLPGAGFDVVPSDCLAAHLVRRCPGAVRLRLAIAGLSRASRGTLKTGVEALGRGTRVRRGGRIVELARPPTARVDFGEGPRRTVAVSWGDVSTAWHSTGVPHIEVHFEAPLPVRLAAGLPGPVRRILAGRTAQTMLKRMAERAPAGPDAEFRTAGRAVILGEAWDAAGRRVAARVVTPEPYALTADSALEVALRLRADGAAAGFRTPSSAFGPDLALDLQGVRRDDLE